ncbi:MAG TPA: cellulose biosynthesis cyclic di-GMP-binding regulatory protein BcsB [Methylophilus sp.]
MADYRYNLFHIILQAVAKPLILVLCLSTLAYAKQPPVQIAAESTERPLEMALTEHRVSTEASVHYPDDLNISFARLLGKEKPMILKGIDANMDVDLPLPGLWQADDVVLTLSGVSSEALNNSSQLIISVNDHIVGQKELGEGQQNFSHQVAIPPQFLKDGFNKVRIRAIQHYTDICEVPLSPQLWTQIDLSESKFVIRPRPRSPSASLNLLPKLFDSATWQEVPTVPVFVSKPSSLQHVSALSYVAQGVGQRYSFVPTRMLKLDAPNSLQALSAAMPAHSRAAVMLATFDEIKPLLQTVDFPTNQGPIIAIKSLPNHHARYIVFLLGKDAAEVKRAAAAFAITGVPWPDNTWTAINKIEIPAQENLEKRFSLPTSGTGAFPLRALGYKNQTVTGIDAESIKFKLWNNTWQGRVQVRIHLSYASGMSNQSALNVIANGVMHGSIPLSNPNGGVYDNYAVTLPAGALRPGWNEVEFQPRMIPANNGGECQPFFVGNLAMTLYEDSTIQKFGGDELKDVDLSTISGAGYLYTEKSLGKGIVFHLASADNDTLSAGMTLVGKLSQIYNRPLLNSSFEVSTQVTDAGEFHYWVGAFNHLPADLQDKLSVAIPRSLSISVPLIQSATVQVHEGTAWFVNILEALNIRSSPPQKFTEVNMEISGEFGNNSFALSSRNDDDEPNIIFTASDQTSLRTGIDTLIDYGQWSQLRGLFSFWKPNSKEIFAISSDNAPFSAYGLRGGLGLWVSQFPWTSLFILLGFIALLVLATRHVMKRYKRRHQQEEH